MNEEKAKEIQEAASRFLASGDYKAMKVKFADAEARATAKPTTDDVFERLKAEVRAHEQKKAQSAEGQSPNDH